MSKCIRCGKKGLFLRLNANKLCVNCVTEVAAIVDADQRRRELELRTLERQALERQASERQALEQQRQNEILSQRVNTPPSVINDFVIVYRYYGVGFYCPDDLRSQALSVPPFKQLALRREPENEYDPDAIAIYYDETKIGYMYKGKLRDMLNDFAAADNKEFLFMSRFWTDEPIYDLFFLLKIEDAVEKLKHTPGSREFTLVGCKNVAMQENLGLVSVYDEVSLDLDWECMKYLVSSSGGDIGFLPKSANNFMDGIASYEARITYLQLNDQLDYEAKVTIVPK